MSDDVISGLQRGTCTPDSGITGCHHASRDLTRARVQRSKLAAGQLSTLAVYST